MVYRREFNCYQPPGRPFNPGSGTIRAVGSNCYLRSPLLGVLRMAEWAPLFARQKPRICGVFGGFELKTIVIEADGKSFGRQVFAL